jgi:hypothetical protein
MSRKAARFADVAPQGPRIEYDQGSARIRGLAVGFGTQWEEVIHDRMRMKRCRLTPAQIDPHNPHGCYEWQNRTGEDAGCAGLATSHAVGYSKSRRFGNRVGARLNLRGLTH